MTPSFVPHSSAGSARGLRRRSSGDPGTRRLRFEPLEERRLLSITVNTLVDENDGIAIVGISLRDAIAAASAGDTINFAPSLTSSGPATIVLTHGELLISKNLTINGPGSALLTIDASGNDPTPGASHGDGSRVILADDFDNSQDKTISIVGLRFTGGDARAGGAISTEENLYLTDAVISGNSTVQQGGGVYSYHGSLSINNSTITGNSAVVGTGFGGGICKIRGSFSVTDSTISNNSARYGGGGISTRFAPDVTITRCTISNNSNLGATTGGGGVQCLSRNFTLTDSKITGNSAAGNGGLQLEGYNGNVIVNITISGCEITNNPGRGIGLSDFTATISRSTISNNPRGGINASNGDLTVTDSTLSGNDAIIDGGAIATALRGSLLIKNCTISGNSSALRGGGILRVQESGTSTILNSTITGNTANSDADSFGSGGGVYFVNWGGSALDLRNSIIAGNFRESGIRDDLAGPVQAKYSLIGVDTGSTISNVGGSQIGNATAPLDPRFGQLVNNGGSVLTHALLPGSPAINSGDPTAVAGSNGVPQYDERGTPWLRVAGGRIDMGAFESQPNPLAGDYNFNRVVDAADYILYRKSLGSTTDLRADGGGNGVIDSADYTYWRARFGNVLASGSALTGADGANSDLATISQFSPAPLRKSLVGGGSDLFSVVAPTLQPPIRAQFHSPKWAALSANSPQPNETNQPTAKWLPSPIHDDWGIQDIFQEGRAAHAGTTNTEAWRFSLVDRAFDQLARKCKLATTAPAIAVQL